MPANEGVSPLRINKPTPSTSPSKMSGSFNGRPLAELSSTERRRNSPSYNQATKKMMLTGRESSPFDSSPFGNSPRLFWKEQTTSPKARFGSENEFEREASLSPKRSSIENLKKASRVKNSMMFAREQKNEYDPTSVQPLERPLAAGRPLSVQVQGNAYGGTGLAGLRQQNEEIKGHRRGESLSKIPTLSPTKSPYKANGLSPYASPVKDTPSPIEGRASPTKSSMASPGRYSHVGKQYNPESAMWSDNDEEEITHPTPRPLRRHAKSVTFDVAPPTINEYEMVTPDPSSVASGSREGSYDSEDFDESFDRDAMDHDDSFDASLEDTDKTPVVLPEDWRHMSPEAANTSLADTFDDPFDGREYSPMPTARPNSVAKPNGSRHGSTTSDSESRPLPPLPGLQNMRGRRESSNGLSAAAERASSSHRSLPTPPRAAGVSKSDILNMRDPSMSLEDRLRLMGIDDRNTDTPTQESHDAFIRSPKNDQGSSIQVHEDPVESDAEETELDIPKISRESILRKVKSRNFEEYDFTNDDITNDLTNDGLASSPERSYGDLADLDPDVPIPSRECSSNFDEQPRDEDKLESEVDSVVDAYSMTEMTELYEPARSPSRPTEEYERDNSVIRHEIKAQLEADDDDASQYSEQPEDEPTMDETTLREEQPHSQDTIETSGPPTPTANDFGAIKVEKKGEKTDLPQFGSFDDFKLGFGDYTRNEPTKPTALESPQGIADMREYLQRPLTPKEPEVAEVELPGTPESASSVIRHPVMIEPPERDSPVVEETVATIKAPGAKLKARPSLRPSDAASMAATRRIVSSEHPPPIPQRSPKRESLTLDFGDAAEEGLGPDSPSTNKENLMLDIPVGGIGEDLSFGLESEFDRLMEAQNVSTLFPLPSYARSSTSSAAVPSGTEHMCGEGFTYQYEPANGYVRKQKGYLMRQNTKLVVASSRQFSDEQPPPPSPTRTASRSANSSPRKTSAEKRPAWTTEPWNGKVRRKSVRTNSGARRTPTSGPAPPLPGQESNVQGGLGSVTEDKTMEEVVEEGTERGRLFVKVVGVKDLDLPLPKAESTHFQLTLDNGLHCVTTSWLELSRTAPIGQEFELVVLDDLEFQLTLQTKLTPPPQSPTIAHASATSPVKGPGHKKSASAFRNLLSSPKKRAKEAERKQQEEAERREVERQAQLKAARTKPQTAWDLLHTLVGQDGSFARAYVCLKNHESSCYGRPLLVDIPCFNEWAVDDSGVSSVKSKRGGVVRRPPYRVGKLTLQLLYVPKPKGATDDDMPTSMKTAIRELQEAEGVRGLSWEGHLSQQGGDCPYWRRRFFRLNGQKLTAYHETTRQPRATINLAKATKLIDDKSSLTQSTQTKNGGRRKSAFSEEEEGYMFVEEGFRMRFANGEVIDFYADNAADKEGWMKVLSETVGKDFGSGKTWADIVLEKERQDALRTQAAPQPAKAQALRENAQGKRPSSQGGRPSSAGKSVPSSPQKSGRGNMPPPPVEKDAIHTRAQGQGGSQRRDQVRSMIF